MLKTGEESPICLLVNGRAISEDEIQTEVERLGRDPSLATIAAEPTRAARVRHAAEHSLICRALVEESAEADERPIEEALVAAELERARSLGGYGKLPDEAQLHAGIVAQLRIARTLQDLAAGALRPTELDVRAFYEAHAGNFSGPEVFQAAHIVKHVNESRDEAQALAEIGQALAELESGKISPPSPSGIPTAKDRAAISAPSLPAPWWPNSKRRSSAYSPGSGPESSGRRSDFISPSCEADRAVTALLMSVWRPTSSGC